MDIVHYLAKYLLVHIVRYRVVGTKDEVLWGIFQYLVGRTEVQEQSFA